MEQEKALQESEEKEKAEKAQKMKDAFGDANGQWEKDKAALQDMVLDDKKTAPEKKAPASGKGKQKKPERVAPGGAAPAEQPAKHPAKRQ